MISRSLRGVVLLALALGGTTARTGQRADAVLRVNPATARHVGVPVFSGPAQVVSALTLAPDITINCWDDAHQDPVLVTTTDPGALNPTDGLWTELLYTPARSYPAVFAAAGEVNYGLPTLRFYTSGVAAGIYEVRAKLYTNEPGRDMKYFYGYQPDAPQGLSVDTVGGAGGGDQFAEYSLGLVTITDGTFNIYVRDAEVTTSGYPFFGWATIRLVQQAAALDHIVVTPATASVPTGATQQFAAQAYDSNGSPVAGLTYAWAATAGGTIDQTGLFTAAATPGTFTNNIVATASGLTGYASASVVPRALDHFGFDPVAGEIHAGLPFAVRITAYDQLGSVFTTYTGPAQLSDTTGTVTPTNLTSFSGGVWSGAVSIRLAAAGVSLTVTDGTPHGTSNSFTVLPPVGALEFTIDCWDDAHQDPVLVTTTDPGALNPTDGLWTEFLYAAARPYPAVFAAAGEENYGLPTMRFYTSGVAAGIYEVWAKLYTNESGRDMRYFYGYQPDAPKALYVDTVGGAGGAEQFAEYSLGLVTITDGTFNLYVRDAAVLTSGYSFFGWATIRLLQTGVTSPLDHITVTPGTAGVVVGGTQQFSAQGYDAGGNAIAGLTYAWTATAGGTIDQTGLFTAGATPGSFTDNVVASVGGVSGHASASVIVGPLHHIVITPGTADVPAAGTQQFSAQGYDAGGNAIAGLTYAWTTTAGGTIDQTGLFTAGATPGSFTDNVVASVGGVSGHASASVIVGPLHHIVITPGTADVPAAGTQQFSAQGYDAGGNAIAGLTYAWTTTAGGTIDQTGLFTAGATPGSFTDNIVASVGGVSGHASASVIVGPLHHIVITPGTADVPAAGTQQFSAQGYDAVGNSVAGLTYVWTTTAGGTIDQTGLFTAGAAPGSFTDNVVASVGGVSGHASANVIVGALHHIVITPGTADVPAAGTQQFSAQGYDAGGNAIAGLTYVWTATAGGTIDQTGLFTAGATPGSFTDNVVASVGGVSGHASANVIVGALHHIVITPGTADVPAAGTQQFSAQGYDAGGNAIAGLTYAWTTTAGGTIDQTGLFTAGAAPGSFTDNVVASVGGVSGHASASVIVGPLHHIVITPGTADVPAAGTQQFSAQGYDAGGNAIAGLTYAWTTTAGGTIDQTGLFTAGAAPGSFTDNVVASVGGVSGHASANVIVGALHHIVITPGTADVPAAGTQQFSAQGYDAGGNAIAGLTYAWTATAGGTIDQTGLFTAGATPGSFTDNIVASVGGVSGHASVSVSVGPLHHIIVTPGTADVPAAGTQQFSAQGYDAGGNTIAGLTYAWTATAGGTIDQTGLFTAGATPGVFTNNVVATVGAVSGHASANVIVSPLHHIVITPGTADVPAAGTQQFSAQGYDAVGNAIAGLTYAWTATAGGTIDQTGLFTAGATPGVFTNNVVATVGGVSGHASANVIVGPLHHIIVTPATANVPAAGTQQFSAQGYDAGGNAIDGLTYTWTATAGGTIDQTGLFTAGATAGVFTNNVVATVGAVSGHASANVIVGSLHHIIVTPATANVPAGGTQQFSAQGYDVGGNPVVGLTYTWSATTGGTIGQTGLFTAGATVGTFTNNIVASAGGVTGYASASVVAGSLDHIVVAPGAATVPSGRTLRFAAQGCDVHGNPIAGLTYTWAATAGGTIDQTGLFTAGATLGTFSSNIVAAVGGVNGYASTSIAAASIGFTGDGAVTDLAGANAINVFRYQAGSALTATLMRVRISTTATGLMKLGIYADNNGAPGAFLRGTQERSSVPTGWQTFTLTAPHTFVQGAYYWLALWTNNNTYRVWAQSETNACTWATATYTTNWPSPFPSSVHLSAFRYSLYAAVNDVVGPVSQIVVNPATASVPAGTIQQFTALGYDVSGLPISGLTYTWTATAGGSVDQTGLFTAGATPGVHTNNIVASNGGISGYASASVVVGPLHHIVITPGSANVPAGATQQFAAQGYDAVGNAIAGLTYTWTATAGGSVDQTGLFTAGATPGTFTNNIVASVGVVPGYASASVVVGPLHHIGITPGSASVPVGATQQFAAQGYDAVGNAIAGLTYTWTATAGGSIDQTGLFTAGATPGNFTNNIVASVGVVPGYASASVVARVLDHFVFDPVSGPVYARLPFGVRITAYDQVGSVLTTYAGSANLSDSTGTLTPTTTEYFSDGVWTGDVVITTVAAGVTVRATDGASGAQGNSNAFDVQAGTPDLAENLVSNPPATASPGTAFQVTDTVINLGTGGAVASTTRYYLSLDTVKDAGDVLLAGARAVGSLGARRLSPGTVGVTIPITTPRNLYYLLACADDTGVVAESDETNNCRASAARVQVIRPNLVESAVSNPPATVAVGGAFQITDTVANLGDGPAATSTTRYYLSVDTVRNSGDILLTGARSVPALVADVTSPGTSTVTVPTGTAGGAYFVLACADDTNLVAESDETDNCRSSGTTVNVTPRVGRAAPPVPLRSGVRSR